MKYNSLKQLIYRNFNIYKNNDAIRYENKKITYTELLQNVEKIAAYLNKMQYTKIGIALENKLETVILILSCILADIPFIILDLNYPKNFLDNILDEANINIVVVDIDIDIDIDGIKTVNIDRTLIRSNFCNKNPRNLINKTKDSVVFLIATSGSTGRPKIAERYMSAFLKDYQELETKFPFLFKQVAQQYAKLNFSYGLENSLLLLIGGTTICFGRKNISIQNIDEMYSEIKCNCATVVFWASPIIKLLSKHFRLCENIPDSIEYIYTGGEPLVISADFVVQLHNKNITLINDYGCSELGKIFTYLYTIRLRDIEAYNAIGVGTPLKGYEAVLLDDKNVACNEGFLYLKSVKKFSCGYVNKNIEIPELNRDDYWLFNTHDIAKRENGQIFILGREINSVNVAGYRVELEQVEYAVNKNSRIDICVVVPFYNHYQEVSLYCFHKGLLSNPQLRVFLQEMLPSYMIPTALVSVESVYLLPNGKVDRKKNARVFSSLIQKQDISAKNVKEQIYNYLIGIVGREIGSLKDIYYQPFFSYGVDSLSVVDFISTVESKVHVKILGDNVGKKIKCLKDVVDLVIDCNGESNSENR